MKNKLLISCLLLVSQISFGQTETEIQKDNAKSFLNFVLKNEKDSCWKLFDVKNVPDVTKEQFDKWFVQLYKDFSIFETFDLSLAGVKITDGNQLAFYSFKAISKSKNVLDDLSVDILFFKNSTLIAGVQPKKLIKTNNVSTSKAKEIEIEKAFKVTIEKKEYEIAGINIVHFENNQGLLVIQVLCELPKNSSNGQEWANKEGVKFAKYLANSDYFKKATDKAKEINRPLLEEIGVSFYDPKLGQGINAMIKKENYSK